MENYYNAYTKPMVQPVGTHIHKRHVDPIYPALTDFVMPLYQVIRFANQAAEKRQRVVITVENKIDNHTFTRSTIQGVFRSGVSQNKQVTFESADGKFLHFFKIEQILSIQFIA